MTRQETAGQNAPPPGAQARGGGVAEGTLPPLAPEPPLSRVATQHPEGPKAASVGRERSPEGDAEPGSASDRPRPRRSPPSGDREGGHPLRPKKSRPSRNEETFTGAPAHHHRTAGVLAGATLEVDTAVIGQCVRPT